MSLSLDRIDALSPVAQAEFSDYFSFEFSNWIAVLIDTLNEVITRVETGFNLLAAQPYTTAEITTLAVGAPNGTFFYDSVTNELKCKVNGVIVVLA